ncbi:TonB-dependent receptor domain-containing protein [Sulfuricurvum sp.]|uniref:TonB-dependent receptor domain-containing protein n=1 Tax=Sulfuricurvum sp. TaxID=2025608 RepID=UPI003BB59229
MFKQTLSLVAYAALVTSLGANTLTLEPIVVSASKTEQPLKNITANVDIITAEEIEERHYTTIAEALNTLSGISITSNGGVGQQDSIFIRGVDSKRVLVVIDGIRYNEPAGLFGAPLAQLSVDDIERIEVIKGAQSGIWGADASGGVVNIITKAPQKGLFARGSVEYGSFDTQKYSSTLSYKTDQGYIKLNANRFDTDGFSAFEAKNSSPNYGKRGDELGLERDGSTNNTYNIQTGLYLSGKDELNFSYKKIDANYDYDNSSSDNTTNVSSLNHAFKSVNYVHTSNSYKIKLYAQQSKFERTQNTFNAKSLVNEFGLQSNLNYTDNGDLVIGFDKQNFKHTNNGLKYQTEGVFISNTNVFGNWVFTESIRYDNNTQFDEKLTGKIGTKYRFSDDFSLSSNFGTAYNAPTLSNLSYTPTLKPESTQSFDATAEYKELKFTYFQNRISDMINYSFTPTFYYFNEDGESTFKGYEVSYQKTLFDNTHVNVNYTHLSAKNSTNQDLERRPKEQLGFGVDYYGFENLHLNLNGSYVGTRYDSVNQTGAQTGKYTLWNAVANYTINKTVKTYVKVDNLFDKYYQTVDGYATSPRAYYAGMEISF